MANTMFDLGLDLQQALFDRALTQQKASTTRASRCGAGSSPSHGSSSRPANVEVGTTPHEVVYEEDSLRLLHYRRETPAKYAEPLLFCYALVNRPYILDLQPDRSVVRQFLARGFDVYLIDWGIPTAADRSMTLHDYIRGHHEERRRLPRGPCADAAVPPARLLHGRHDVHDLHRRCTPSRSRSCP